MTILPKTRKNSQSQRCDRTPQKRQLDLLHRGTAPRGEPAAAPKSLTAKLAPASHHQTDQDRYWLICGYDGRPFGGLYYREEADHILQHFERWRGPILASAFGVVAERAIQLRNQRLEVAP